jgi:hypothetical protein
VILSSNEWVVEPLLDIFQLANPRQKRLERLLLMANISASKSMQADLERTQNLIQNLFVDRLITA